MVNPLTQFGLSDLELHAEMARDPLVMAERDTMAHRIEDSLKQKAPVFGDRPPHRDVPAEGEPGDFRDSIHTETFRDKEGLPAARVGSTSPIALWQELGTKHFPEMAIFAQTAREFGDTTGPIFTEGIQRAQSHLREQLKTLAEMRLAGAASDHLDRQRRVVEHARTQRSAAFKAARGPRRRGRRG